MNSRFPCTDENLFRQILHVYLGNEAIEDQGGKAVNQAPSRHPGRMILAGPPIGADLDAPKQTEHRVRGLVQIRIFGPFDQNGAKHQAKETPIVQSEIDISETDGWERIPVGRARLHHRCEFSEAFRGDRRKQILLVVEVSIRGCCRNSDAARDFPQADGFCAGFVQEGSSCRAQGLRYVAVVITTSRGSNKTFHSETFSDKVLQPRGGSCGVPRLAVFSSSAEAAHAQRKTPLFETVSLTASAPLTRRSYKPLTWARTSLGVTPNARRNVR